MNLLTKISFVVALSAGLFLTGCGDGIPPQKRPPAASDDHDDHGHDHDGGGHGHDDHAGHHGHEGPHGGHVFDLGHEHSFHAELTDDHSTDTVTVYMLDKDLKQAKTEQTSVTLVLTVDGKTESFELAGDGSMFSASSTAMLELLEADGAKGKLRVNIDGKAMSGSFSHEDHEHDEHGHDDDHGHDH